MRSLPVGSTLASLDEGTEKAVQLVLQIISETAATGAIAMPCSEHERYIDNNQSSIHSSAELHHIISLMARTTPAFLEEGTEAAVQLALQIISETAATGKSSVPCSQNRTEPRDTTQACSQQRWDSTGRKYLQLPSWSSTSSVERPRLVCLHRPTIQMKHAMRRAQSQSYLMLSLAELKCTPPPPPGAFSPLPHAGGDHTGCLARCHQDGCAASPADDV